MSAEPPGDALRNPLRKITRWEVHLMRTRIAVPVAAVSAAAAVLGVVALASGQPASQAGSAAQAKLDKRVLFAFLTGNKEVDTEGNRGGGDPDGRGTFTATIDGDQLCFGITVKNIDDARGGSHPHAEARAGPATSSCR